MNLFKSKQDLDIKNVDCQIKDGSEATNVPGSAESAEKSQEPDKVDKRSACERGLLKEGEDGKSKENAEGGPAGAEGGDAKQVTSATFRRSPYERFLGSINDMIDGPVTWFRTNIVEKNKTPYPWYHEKYNRVPTIDTCFTDDVICYFEANMQFKRDHQVDNEILSIIRQRFEECVLYEAPDHLTKCKSVYDQYQKALENWFTKYGDLGPYGDVRSAYMKQKHRMLWERKYGKIGCGMCKKKTEEDPEGEGGGGGKASKKKKECKIG